MRYTFEAFDAENFITPGCYYVGATFNHDNENCSDELPRFVREGLWENGFGTSVQKYTDRMDKINKGDILIVKRLCGQGSKLMNILAVGVIVGKSLQDSGILFVEWSVPFLETPMTVPLFEIGTLSGKQDLSSLVKPVQLIVRKAQARFLRWNLNIIKTIY